jgi:hypothetical protein
VSSTSYVRRTLDSGSDAEVMLSKPILVQRLQDLTQQECALEPAASSDLHVNNDTQALLSAISSFCVAQTADAKAECCTAEGAGLSELQQVGEPSEFVVTLMDGEGGLIKCVRDMAGIITAEATMLELEDAKIDAGAGAGAGAGAVMVPVLVVAEAAPAMKCTYTATHAGKLSIGVKVFGQHVAGSPFEVQTTAGLPFDYGFTHLCSDVEASGEGNRRVTKNMGEGRCAIAIPGISEGAMFWDAKFHQVQASGPWIFMGVIANTAPVYTSYSDGTTYGWSSNEHAWVAGVGKKAYLGWPDAGWQTGDEATFKMDCQARTLSMKHKRFDKSVHLGRPPRWQDMAHPRKPVQR